MNFLAWLKSEGISVGLDLGNFSVGFATTCIALVSLFIALRSGKSTSNLKTAEFRQAWIERLRAAVSSFLGVCSETANFAMSRHEGVDRSKDLDMANSNLKEIEAQIRLLLNISESDHRMLIALTQQMRGRAASISIHLQSKLAFEIDELEVIVGDLTALILKNEWKRVNDDTFGRSRLSRFWKQWLLDRRLASHRDDVAARADKFLPKPT